MVHSYMDSQVDPCDDFFKYACGKFEQEKPQYIRQFMDWKKEFFIRDIFTTVMEKNLTEYKSQAMDLFFRKVRKCGKNCAWTKMASLIISDMSAAYRIARDKLIPASAINWTLEVTSVIVKVIVNLSSCASDPQLDARLREHMMNFKVDSNFSQVYLDDRLFDLVNNHSVPDAEYLIDMPPIPPMKMYGPVDKYGFYLHSKDVCE